MDILLTVCLLLCCALSSHWLGRKVGAWRPGFSGVQTVVCVLLCAWLTWSSGIDMFWASAVPFGNVLLMAKAPLLLLTYVAGLLKGASSRPAARTSVLSASLWVTTTLCIAMLPFRPAWLPIELASVSSWRDGVCLQSHESSCTPAAAATLLARHQIPVSERRMAQVCLTNENGTLAIGALRGLAVATQRSSVRPAAVAYGDDLPSSAELADKLPMLVHVSFIDKRVKPTNFLGIALDKRRNAGHSVVVLERLPDNKWLIADPAVGKVTWTDERLRNSWIGEGIYLKDRR